MTLKGSYCLCIRIDCEVKTRVGALGTIVFHRGFYVYVGSALNSLIPRLNRHIKTNKGEGKAVHWHIDYLLKAPSVELEAIWVTNWAVRMECEIAKNIAEKGDPIHRFGSSDCGCVSHLYRVNNCNFLKELGLTKLEPFNLITYQPTQQ